MGECDIECDQVKKVIAKKRNWSAPGPGRIVNYWWKRAETLHESVALSFREIGLGDLVYTGENFADPQTRRVF